MGLLENGTALVENLVPTGLVMAASKLVEAPRDLAATVATRMVEAIAINSLSEKVRRGRTVIVKRRNLHSEQLADLANLYFKMADIPIRFWSKVEDWQRWEVDCFQMLNGDRYRAYASGTRSVVAEKLPGKSLWEHLNAGTITKKMLHAAAAEFRRAHQFWSDEFRGRWSHGDGTSQNVMYDAAADRARLIDFEIVHEKSLATAARQADDLLVFLLDLVGPLSTRDWVPFATTFLEAYGGGEVIAQLQRQLDLPGGLAWIWWGVRTNFTNPAKVKRRLENLSRAIGKLKLHEPTGSERGRNKRRPSMSCQVTKPGTPRASSRTLAIKDKAKALVPSIPRRLPIKT